MELGLSFFIFLELRAHVFGNLLLLELHLLDNCIIVSLLRLIVFLDISHAGAECSEFLDAWRQLSFLLLYLLFNLLNECGQFLQRLTLVIVKLLFKFRHALNLILDR